MTEKEAEVFFCQAPLGKDNVEVCKALDKATKGKTLEELSDMDKEDLIWDVVAALKETHPYWAAARHRHL